MSTQEPKQRRHTPMSERLQKVLARSGQGSRRQIEKDIEAGQVLVNGKKASLGQAVKEGDKINYKKRVFEVQRRPILPKVLLYNKPEGEICTRHDPEGRKTVFSNLPKLKNDRWINIGRLDINTSGLLLFTTDGKLANHLMHPSAGVDREYACRVFGEVTDEMIENLKRGVELEDGPARFSDIQKAGEGESNQWFHVVLMEGRNREVRRLWESQGVQVNRLKRVRYGPVFLPKKLRKGQSMELSPKDVKTLYEDVGLESDQHELVAKHVRR